MSKLLLGKLIRKLRKQKGLSLRKLAEKVDISFVNIAHIENGRVTTSEEIIKQLAKALDYDVDKLLAAQKPATPNLQTAASAPPAMAISISPFFILFQNCFNLFYFSRFSKSLCK